MLLYCDDTATDKFLLATSTSSNVLSSSMNPLLIISAVDAIDPLTLYTMVSVLLTVQVNCTVVPSTAAVDTGSTINSVRVVEGSVNCRQYRHK